MTDDDDVLLGELATLLGPLNEPPPEVLHAAREVFTWRTVDAELAALTSDSLFDGEPVGSRSATPVRTLTFDAGDVLVEVEISGRPGERRLIGHLDPPEAAELELRTADGSVLGTADELGRFVLDLPAERQSCSLLCRLAGGTVQTAWTVM